MHFFRPFTFVEKKYSPMPIYDQAKFDLWRNEQIDAQSPWFNRLRSYTWYKCPTINDFNFNAENADVLMASLNNAFDYYLTSLGAEGSRGMVTNTYNMLKKQRIHGNTGVERVKYYKNAFDQIIKKINGHQIPDEIKEKLYKAATAKMIYHLVSCESGNFGKQSFKTKLIDQLRIIFKRLEYFSPYNKNGSVDRTHKELATVAEDFFSAACAFNYQNLLSDIDNGYQLFLEQAFDSTQQTLDTTADHTEMSTLGS